MADIVNGKRSWISATQAIWFYPEFEDWAIGPLDNIGTNIQGITTGGNYQDLFDVANDDWKYGDHDGWTDVNSGDIAINCAKVQNRS